MTWLSENIGTIVVAAIVAALIVTIICSMIKKKKSGKGGCSCGCSNCAMSEQCQSKK